MHLDQLDVLRASLKTLQHNLSFQTSVLEWFSFAVVAGVALEVVIDVIEHVRDRERRSTWRLFLLCLCGVLIVGGLFGEFVEGGRVSTTTGNIQQTAEREVQTVETRLSETQQQLSNTSAQLASAQIQLADATKEAAAANQAAEADRLARVKIEERLAWRGIDSKQRTKYIEELAPYPGTWVMIDMEGNGDPEVINLAKDLMLLLGAAHWKVETLNGNIRLPAQRGILCQINDNVPAGKALRNILKNLPNTTFAPLPTPLGKDVAYIRIGMRPPP